MTDQIQVARVGGAGGKPGRLAYIDWMRGLACVLMFQTHCYGSWLIPEARKTEFYRWSQAAGTLPAPLFIFLAGVLSAMGTQRVRGKGVARNAIARTTIFRGAGIFWVGLLFWGQGVFLGYSHSPWRDFVLGDSFRHVGEIAEIRDCRGTGGSRLGRAGDAVAVDNLSAAMVAVAAGVVHRRRARLWTAASVVVSALSLGSVCVCGAGAGLPAIF